jgi:AcrR family transcriptional regulator
MWNDGPMTDELSGRRLGRPRDPDIEARAFAAAREVYQERGWSGFAMEQVTRRSGLGKGSLYLRWPDRAALLVDAVRDTASFITTIDTGSMREDLIQFGRRYLDFVRSDDWALMRRLAIDARYHPEVRSALQRDSYPSFIRATRAIVRRGRERGEIPPSTPTALIADLVAGAVTNHATSTAFVPAEVLGDRFDPDRYVTQIVDTVLAGVRAMAAGTAGPADDSRIEAAADGAAPIPAPRPRSTRRLQQQPT